MCGICHGVAFGVASNVICMEEDAGGGVGERGVGSSGCVKSVVEVVGAERYGVGVIEHVVEKAVS